MAEKTWMDDLYSGLGSAVDDVRAKYENAVWGREVTGGREEAPAWPQAQQEPEPPFGSSTREIEPALDRSMEQERDREMADRGIDL